MIRGKENILTWFNSTGCNYWTIYNYGKTDGTKTFMNSDRGESATAARAYQELGSALDLMDGKYSMACTGENKRTTRQDFHEDIEVSRIPGAYAAHITGPPVVQGMGPDEVAAKIAEALEKHEDKKELERLRRENTELKREVKALEKETQEPLNRIIAIAGPHLDRIFGGAQRQVAGLPTPGTQQPDNDHLAQQHPNEPEEEVINLTPEENQRLVNVVSIFYTVAPGEWLQLLEKLAAKLEANPGMINMLKSFL